MKNQILFITLIGLSFGIKAQNTFPTNGNVGIGTTNPTQKLDVSGDALINGLTVGRGNRHIHSNTVIGIAALNSNTTGFCNTVIGNKALILNTEGYFNIATGYGALRSNTTGFSNTAIGAVSLKLNTGGYYNVAAGYQSLSSNTIGSFNTANGVSALVSNIDGHSNTGSGYRSLYKNTNGHNNSAFGSWAGSFRGATGTSSNLTGSNNLYLGALARASASGLDNEIVIGFNALGNGNNSVVLGNDKIVTTVLKGNVGIGTNTPDSGYKLTVKGNISTREVKVTATAGGADFVFEDTYKLPTLKTVEQFITENKHLPEIASAKEMEENGIHLSRNEHKTPPKNRRTHALYHSATKRVRSHAQHQKNKSLEARLEALEAHLKN